MPQQGWLALAAFGATLGVCAPPARSVPASQPAEPQTALYLAESPHGAQFTPRNEVLVAEAAHPDLVSLPDKHLLAVFECRPKPRQHSSTDSPPASNAQIHHGGTVDRDLPELWATRSTDNGKTWLPARPIRLPGLPEGSRIGSPDLVLMPSGLVRLYFAAAEKADRARARGGTFIGSAVTRDGIEYQVDRQVRIPCPGLESPRLSAFWADKQLVLFVAGEAQLGNRSNDRGGMVQQYLSTDGRTFAAPDRARFAGEIGHVVRRDQYHWRMFISAGGDIRSRMSNDGIRWRDEAGICLRGGAGPAVAQVERDTFIMVFASALTSGVTGSLSASESTGGQAASGTKQSAAPSGDKTGPDNVQKSDTTGWDTFAPRGYESELGADWTGGAEAQQQSTATDELGLAPLPDFHTKFDYIGWFEQNCSLPADQNAATAYADAIATLKSYPDGTLKNMFNDEAYSGPPIPWNGTTRPEWEASYLATQDLIAQFRSGSEDPRTYATPLVWSPNSAPENRLLIDILLPNLAGYRNMTKATMGQAWREQNGVIPVEQMRTALETVLGNAAHLYQGSSTIECLVGVAEQSLANQNARWALARGVFQSADEVQATLDTLRAKDPGQTDPGRFVRSEHAWSMDMLQFMFKEDTPDSEPTLQLDRLEKLVGLIDDKDREAISKTHIDARGSAEAMDSYYRQMIEYYHTEYPYESPSRFSDLAEQIKEQHPITGPILASLSRAGEHMRRAEANRRATQLTYSVELFRAQHGRYPASFDELPSDQVADVRTDPYSRQDFAYRLTGSGPMIYSVSNNGQDDGGVHSRRWGDEKKEGESDDFVFWPPQE